MREAWLVAKREFLERARTRAFLIGTFAFPLLMAGLMVLPALADRSTGGQTRTIALIDEAPPGIADAFVAVLTAESEDENANLYVVERVSGTLEQAEAEVTRRVLDEEIYGFVALPAEVLDSNRVVYRARNVANIPVMRDISRALTRGVQAERLRRAGLDGGAVTDLIRSVQVDESQVTESGQPGRSAGASFGYAYAVAFLIYFMVIFYGTSVTRSVIEEKNNRISEVLVSSMRAEHLMLGKVVGVGAAALAQISFWMATVIFLVSKPEILQSFIEIPPGLLASFSIPLGTGLLFVAYFLLGFGLYAAGFAALGAAMTSDQEAQSAQMTVMMPLIIPLMFILVVVGDPLGTIATVLGIFPLTSPITAPMRIAATPVPVIQTIASLALLALAMVAVTWLAGRIYRIGILSTGKKASMRDLINWMRAS